MKHKVFGVVAAAMVAVGLAACGSDTAESKAGAAAPHVYFPEDASCRTVSVPNFDRNTPSTDDPYDLALGTMLFPVNHCNMLNVVQPGPDVSQERAQAIVSGARQKGAVREQAFAQLLSEGTRAIQSAPTDRDKSRLINEYRGRAATELSASRAELADARSELIAISEKMK